jgi:hypothetical protein
MEVFQVKNRVAVLQNKYDFMYFQSKITRRSEYHETVLNETKKELDSMKITLSLISDEQLRTFSAAS